MTDFSESAVVSDDPLGMWYLHIEYTVVQAALLIAGHDPAEFEDVEQLSPGDRPKDYEAAKTALVKHMERSFSFGNEIQHDRKCGGGINVYRSTVRFDEVRKWLAERGQTKGFFFGKKGAPGSTAPNYLNPDHPRYAPKLAAAVRAWEAAENLAQKSAKSPKTILSDWLKEHAEEFGLSSDGRLNETGIEEVAKVANWKPEGGAPKTPEKS